MVAVAMVNVVPMINVNVMHVLMVNPHGLRRIVLNAPALNPRLGLEMLPVPITYILS
jgi:hypothetical protein